MRYVVTGGAGFIGSHLCEALAGAGSEVVVIDDLSSGRLDNLRGLDVELVRGSVTDMELLKEVILGADCVFHLAAIPSVQKSMEDPRGTTEVNLLGTLNVLGAAGEARVRKVVYVSSAAVYGDSPELPKREDMPTSPRSPYALAKLAGECYCKLYSRRLGLEAAVLRYFNVYGPRQDPRSEYSGVISRFMHSAMDGARPVVYGDGEQTRDFVYVKDVVRATVLASRKGVQGTYNVATGRGTSLNQLLGAISEVTGRRLHPSYARGRAGDIRHSLADVSRLGGIGFRADYAVGQGLREMVGQGESYASK